MTASSTVVWVVDDEAELRDAIVRVLRSVGLQVEPHASARAFLDAADLTRAGCLVTDVRMPGMSGIELLEQLQATGRSVPAVVMTLHGDAPTAVRAMKAGAFDFIEKPFREQALIDVVHKALLHGEKTATRRARRRLAREAVNSLTPREREVFERIVIGRMNKEIARELDLSVRTVELHRAHVMGKTGTSTVSELVTLAIAAAGDDET